MLLEARRPIEPVAPKPNAAAVRLMRQTERLIARGRLAVVYAGDAHDPGAVVNRTVNLRPWKSYRAVAEDIRDGLVRLGAASVELVPETMRMAPLLADLGIDFVWLNTAGVQGAAPACHAPAVLEMAGIPYVGHNPLTAALLDDKHAFKRQLAAAGLPTAPAMVWKPQDGPLLPDRDPVFRRTFGERTQGFVVKPINGRASLNVHHVNARRDLIEAVLAVYEATGNAVLIEAYLPGREFFASVAGPVVRSGDRLRIGGDPFVFGCMERRLDPGEPIFTSMDRRPINADLVRPLDPVVDEAVLAELTRLAVGVYRELDVETLIRLDVRADAEGRLFVLEANPKPDLKYPNAGVTSLVAEGLTRSGLSYDDLLFSLVADRLSRQLAGDRGDVRRLTDLVGD